MRLLGQGCGETLPSLRRVPPDYRLETNGERLYRLCLALVERNLADEDLWQKTGKVAVVFARSAIQNLIEEFSGRVLEDKVEYCCEVRDDFGRDTAAGGDLDDGNSWLHSKSNRADTSRLEPASARARRAGAIPRSGVLLPVFAEDRFFLD